MPTQREGDNGNPPVKPPSGHSSADYMLIAILIIFSGIFAQIYFYGWNPNLAPYTTGFLLVACILVPLLGNWFFRQSLGRHIASLSWSLLSFATFGVVAFLGINMIALDIGRTEATTAREFASKDFALVDAKHTGMVTDVQLNELLKGQDILRSSAAALEHEIERLSHLPLSNKQAIAATLNEAKSELQSQFMPEDRYQRLIQMKNLVPFAGHNVPKTPENGGARYAASAEELAQFQDKLASEYGQWYAWMDWSDAQLHHLLGTVKSR